MTGSARQLVLDLPHRQALDAEDFIVTASNTVAVSMIDSWPDWPHPCLVLVGAAGSGKTHLGNVWRRQSGAQVVSAAALTEELAAQVGERGPCLVEDADRGIASERALFHLMNLAREHRAHILVTGRTSPGGWEVTLPDLVSRLRACPVVSIEEPDEALLRAVLVKLLVDRQLPATPAAVAFLARHMERSMQAAVALVDEIDRILWAKPRGMTRPIMKEALERVRHRSGGGGA